MTRLHLQEADASGWPNLIIVFSPKHSVFLAGRQEVRETENTRRPQATTAGLEDGEAT